MRKSRFFILLLGVFSALEADGIGSLLFHGNCTTCHYETKALSAPSMYDVRERYIKAYDKKDDFVSYMSKWVANPNKETSIMLDAVQKYGLMPHLGYEEDVIKEITRYIYDTDFKKLR